MEQKMPPNPIANKVAKKKVADYFKMNKKDETTLLMFFIVLVCAVLGYFVLFPATGSYSDGRIQEANLTNEKNTLQSKQTNLQGLKKDLTERSDFISRTEDAMPTTAQVPELLVTLSKLASNNSLYLTNFSPQEVTANTNANVGPEGEIAPAATEYSQVEISFDVSGKYLDMKQFLKDVETNIRPINILNINISGGGEISNTISTETLRFSIKAEAYYKAKQ
ncbi:MAG: type 4a pilus biogenesis protein PilO [Patescibacteria group bacterium]|nr:type 4a pilus biogenesis protein PilO [Patescibacteria group bacterium]